MARALKPAVDQWYRRLDTGEMFRVVAVDADEGWVEIQSFDGGIEQLADDDWRALNIEPCEPSEDWTGPYDVETADLDYAETEMAVQDWRTSVDGALPPPEEWEDATREDEGDE